MKIKKILLLLTGFVLISLSSNISFAQNNTPVKTAVTGAQELAKKLANPVANMISVPFQNNTVWGIGPNNGSQNILNIQPVIPISISKNWNIINRIIVPFVGQFNITGIGTSQNALADIQLSTFLSPASSKVIWGVGTIMSFPSATNKYTGSGRYSIGPTGVILYQTNGWTIGTLVNQYWSVGGNPDRGNATQGYLQPFVTYNWKSGAGIALNSEITQNWKIKRTQAYIDFVLMGLTKFGKFPVQLQAGPRIPLTALPDLKGYFGVRAQICFIFPK